MDPFRSGLAWADVVGTYTNTRVFIKSSTNPWKQRFWRTSTDTAAVLKESNLLSKDSPCFSRSRYWEVRGKIDTGHKIFDFFQILLQKSISSPAFFYPCYQLSIRDNLRTWNNFFDLQALRNFVKFRNEKHGTRWRENKRAYQVTSRRIRERATELRKIHCRTNMIAIRCDLQPLRR